MAFVDVQGSGEAGELAVGEVLGCGVQQVADAVERVVLAASRLEASWLTVVRYDAYSLFVDCRDVTEVGTVPVRKYEHIPDDLFTPRAGCFTAAVMVWTELIEQGVYHWVDGRPAFEPAMPRGSTGCCRSSDPCRSTGPESVLVSVGQCISPGP